MHVQDVTILDKLTITVIILQICKFEVQTSPEETEVLYALTPTSTKQVIKSSKKHIHLYHFHSKVWKKVRLVPNFYEMYDCSIFLSM